MSPAFQTFIISPRVSFRSQVGECLRFQSKVRWGELLSCAWKLRELSRDGGTWQRDATSFLIQRTSVLSRTRWPCGDQPKFQPYLKTCLCFVSRLIKIVPHWQVLCLFFFVCVCVCLCRVLRDVSPSSCVSVFGQPYTWQMDFEFDPCCLQLRWPSQFAYPMLHINIEDKKSFNFVHSKACKWPLVPGAQRPLASFGSSGFDGQPNFQRGTRCRLPFVSRHGMDSTVEYRGSICHQNIRGGFKMSLK